MKRTLIISIAKRGDIIGNVLLSWDGLNFLNSIRKTIDIIDNYNKNLINADLPDEIFALRMLQEENKSGTQNLVCALMLEDSDKYVRSLYGKYLEDEELFSISEESRTIAILEKDIMNNLEYSDIHVRIDLNNMLVEFFQGMLAYNSKDAKEKFGIDIKTLPVLKKELSKSIVNETANYNKVSFNALSDFYNFVEKNVEGWVIENLDSYLVKPII